MYSQPDIVLTFDVIVGIYIWIALSIVAGVISKSKGRYGMFYFVLSMLFSPLVGVLLAIGMAPKK